MKLLRAAAAELFGMFVDDGSLALALLLLVALVSLAVKVGGLLPLAGALALLGGCNLLLVESVLRAARRKAGNDG